VPAVGGAPKLECPKVSSETFAASALERGGKDAGDVSAGLLTRNGYRWQLTSAHTHSAFLLQRWQRQRREETP
jgi:hypothetical protein